MDQRRYLLLGGLALGAGLMFFFDPARGRRRRALARERGGHFLRVAGRDARRIGRDFRNRARGLIAEERRKLDHTPVPDEVLVARVRAKLGHVISHPKDIEVAAHDGQVVFRGRVPNAEVADLLIGVHEVPGVRDAKFRVEVGP
jgi:hypothetical protein